MLPHLVLVSSPAPHVAEHGDHAPQAAQLQGANSMRRLWAISAMTPVAMKRTRVPATKGHAAPQQ